MYEDFENKDNNNNLEPVNKEGSYTGASETNTSKGMENRPSGGVFSSQHYDFNHGNRDTNESNSHSDPKSVFGNHKVKYVKEKNPFWGRFFATIGLGVVFGLTAGVTIYFLNLVVKNESSSVNNPKTAIVEDIEDNASSEDKTEVTNSIDEAIGNSSIAKNEIKSAESNAVDGVIAYDVSAVVEDVMPSVVSIIGNYKVTQRDFFGQTYSQETAGSGSGIIIGKDDSNLYIATNNHVVEDSTQLSVQFIDGSQADARVKGTNEDLDLAVILVDIDELEDSTRKQISVAKLGDSDSLKVGETAIAIGNALGYGQSVTAGVISAVDRSLSFSDGSQADGLIQTDAAINPGNSGGALVNIEGEVIGINSSKIGGSTVDGVGFAIPISSAEPILSDIATSEEKVKVSEAKSGYLGIGGVSVTSEVSQMYGMPVGVVIRQVYAGTGAESAGLSQGDVIVGIDNETVESMEDLRELLQYYEKDTKVSVEYYRMEDGEYVKKTAEVQLVDKETLQNASTNQ